MQADSSRAPLPRKRRSAKAFHLSNHASNISRTIKSDARVKRDSASRISAAAFSEASVFAFSTAFSAASLASASRRGSLRLRLGKRRFLFRSVRFFHLFALCFLFLRKLVAFLDGGFFRLIYLLYAVIQNPITAFLFVHTDVNYIVNSLDFQVFSENKCVFFMNYVHNMPFQFNILNKSIQYNSKMKYDYNITSFMQS